jgi:N-acetylglucosaminyldiphosphoundecaprenol N-acetyl-beta-D-mannosaminyltransferase
MIASHRTRRRVSVLGCDIDALTLPETLVEVDRLVRAGRPAQHCSINAAKAVMLDRDPRLRAIVAACALVNADGQAVVWASRFLGRPLPARVTGIDLFRALLGVAEDHGYTVYFLGATAEVAQAVVSRARRDHPCLNVAGWHHGYWGSDDDIIIAGVRAAQPHFLFLAIPSPRKEFWLAEHLEALAVPFCMGVGGSFDVYAGKTKRAPLWMQTSGLEWAYRLCQEPAKMWRRYLFGNAAFVWLLLRSVVDDRRGRIAGLRGRVRGRGRRR